MRKMQDRFAHVLRTEAGHKFRGEFGDPNAYPRPRKELQNLPHRSLVADRHALVAAGNTVVLDGVTYLLAGQHTLVNTKSFLAVEVFNFWDWTTLQEYIDPVARVERDSHEVVVEAALPVIVEPTRVISEEEFRITQKRIFTSRNIPAGDFLGGFKVMQSVEVLGLYMLEVV